MRSNLGLMVRDALRAALLTMSRVRQLALHTNHEVSSASAFAPHGEERRAGLIVRLISRNARRVSNHEAPTYGQEHL